MTDSHRLLEPMPSGYPRLPECSAARARAVLGIGCGVVLFLTIAPLISRAVTGIGWLIDGRPAMYGEYVDQAARFQYPAGMLAANLGIIALIPITLVIVMVINRARGTWVLSVTGRLRWRYLAGCLAVAAAIFGIAALAIQRPGVGGLSGDGWVFLVIILATSPLQAAAEEVFFRGYLTQAVGTLTGQTGLGILAPALLFTFWHGNQNLPLLASRFVFGLFAGLLVWATGGLEAAIAAHVANNLGSYLPALLSGGLTTTRTVTEVSWTASGFQIGVYATFAVAAWLLARRSRLQTRRTYS